jgi:hypothetical protein
MLECPFTLPLKLYADNTGAITLLTEAANHIHTKYIDLHYHFICKTFNQFDFRIASLASGELDRRSATLSALKLESVC